MVETQKRVGFWTWWLSILRTPLITNIFVRVFEQLYIRNDCVFTSSYNPKITNSVFWKFQLQTFFV